MIAAGNVDRKWSEKKMDVDDGLRTVECLRGRLLAERAASRVAKEDAEQMSNKLVELENQLRREIKSRNKAEKRLKFLLKKLESMNKSNVSEDSEHSGLVEKSDLSSVSSSTASLGTKEPEDHKEPNTQITNPAKCHEIEESVKMTNCPSRDLEDNVWRTTTSNQSHCSPSIEDHSLSFAKKANSEKPSEVESNRNQNSPKTDHQSELGINSANFTSSSSSKSTVEQEDEYVDNSLALVPVDLPKESKPTEPLVLNASVKDVLDALRHAGEKLQRQMERRRIIEVGSK